jgi:hypothetical protein
MSATQNLFYGSTQLGLMRSTDRTPLLDVRVEKAGVVFRHDLAGVAVVVKHGG